MGDNKKLLNLHEKKFAELEASNTNSQIFQKTTNASLKNLETQIGQLALNLQNQMKDAFPRDTKKNPKDCMAVVVMTITHTQIDGTITKGLLS